MQWFCLRVDLDFVPWDAEDPAFVAHLLRLWARSRERGWRLHHFVSARCLQALPSLADSALNEGHDLDWLVHSPASAHAEWNTASACFARLGHKPRWVAGIELYGELQAVPGENVWQVRPVELEAVEVRVAEALVAGLVMKTLRTL